MAKKQKYTVVPWRDVVYNVCKNKNTVTTTTSQYYARRIASALNRADGVCECDHAVSPNAYGWRFCPWCGKKVAAKK